MGWLGKRNKHDEQSAADSSPEAEAEAEADVAAPELAGRPDASGEAQAPGWPSRGPIVVGAPTPAFEPKAVDKEYGRTPYRADTVIDGWSSGAFTVRAASVRGYLHRYGGAPRQDDFAITVDPERQRLVVAVADGVSSAKYSHVGSSTVVRYATRWLEEPPEPLDDGGWHTLFKSAAWTLTEQAAAVLSLPEADAEQAERMLATTLACAVCEPHPDGGLSAVVAAVGDSGVWLLTDGTFVPVLGGKEQSPSGLSCSAVVGLPRVPNDVAPQPVIIEPGQVLLVGTDGFGDPLGSGEGGVGALFAGLLGDRVPSQIEFAHALDFSRETFDDDRTLVAIWPPSS
ncbi:protein phosphatase 2C domain-containing protein [Nocardia sp. bgisy134]|uniref:protein phosphatase 2C domain-containing protein n=1 Tax=Nocardia sp. bgisy134 TaxID=3413789 RepID=UPI003D71F24A